MKIGYRRYSGPAFLSPERVQSKRGAWLEKRIAFVEELKKRGHSVQVIETDDSFKEYDLVFIEFGSLNRMFHPEDIAFSEKIAAEHPKTIFLLDDPDMFPKGLKIKEAWVNGDAQRCMRFWGVPCVSFPFYALQPILAPKDEYRNTLVYYGGTSGRRERRISILRTILPVDVYGAEKDFETLSPKEPPAQAERASFYSNFAACLNITDDRHKRLKWNTGRRFHAICAGCPAIDEGPLMFTLANQVLNSPVSRRSLIDTQQAMVREARMLVDKAFAKHGL